MIELCSNVGFNSCAYHSVKGLVSRFGLGWFWIGWIFQYILRLADAAGNQLELVKEVDKFSVASPLYLVVVKDWQFIVIYCLHKVAEEYIR